MQYFANLGVRNEILFVSSVTGDVHSSPVFEYRDVLHPDYNTKLYFIYNCLYFCCIFLCVNLKLTQRNMQHTNGTLLEGRKYEYHWPTSRFWLRMTLIR